jgi:hypothetical protein
MRGARADRCKARVDGAEMICMGCDAECGVHRASSRMRDQGVRVYMVPHATGFSHSLEHRQREPGVGVAAVACLLNITSGWLRDAPTRHPFAVRSPRSSRLPEALGAQNRSTNVNQEKLVQIAAGDQKKSSPD